MTDKPQQSQPLGGFIGEIYFRIRLIMRLMGDRRVSGLLKLIPVAAVGYLVWPIDIPGPIDDAGVLWLGSSLFIDLCPPEVVAEHSAALGRGSYNAWQSQPDSFDQRADENVIDAEFRDK